VSDPIIPFQDGGFSRHFGWGAAHSGSFVMHAASHGDHRAWLSVARSKKDALSDLDQLAGQIKLGEEPDPSHHRAP
jgi:hypothetical protein